MATPSDFVELNDKKYEIVTLDFETYFDSEYTLSGKLNTSEYIRDARFQVHGVGIKKGDGKTYWYTGSNIPLALAEINWGKTALLCHNTAFDGFICSEVYGHRPGLYLDTLGMSRAVHGHTVGHTLDDLAKRHGRKGKVKRSALANTKGKRDLTDQELRALGGYCVDDVDDTFGVFWDMYDHMPDDELRLIDMTMRMFCDAKLKIDVPRAEAELQREVGGKVAALLKSGATTEQLLSNEKFAELLRARGINPPMKVSPSTGKLTYAFAKSDEGLKALLQHSNAEITNLVNARLKIKSTIGETRAARFIEAGKDNMTLPILLNYSGAHTHRWSGGNKMNLQNLTRGGELRKSILAPDGHVIVVADSSQIEARVLAWLAGQQNIIDAFARGEDVYKLMASIIYNKPMGQVTKDERFIGKCLVLGLGYGMGATKLQATLKAGMLGPPVELDMRECYRLVDIYRRNNAAIVRFWELMDMHLHTMSAGRMATAANGALSFGKGFIQLPNGLFLRYDDLSGEVHAGPNGQLKADFSYQGRRNRLKIYGGLLTENITQALARCIVAEQMLKIHDMGYRIVSMTHDEIIAICPKKQAKKCLADMLAAMSTAPDWAKGVPLAAEGDFDVNYSK